MWIFTQTGFVSAVADSKDNDKMVVRARDKKSLKPFIEATGAEIVEIPNRDYEYRIYVDKTDFARCLTETVMSVDYNNFKNRIWDTRGDRYHDVLSRVWGVMLDVSDKYPPKSYSIVDEMDDEMDYIKGQLEEILEDLPPTTQQVVRLRFGLGDEKLHTLQEVGKALNVSRQEVLDIERKVISMIY